MRDLKFSEHRMEIQVLESYIISTGAVTDIPEECGAFVLLSEVLDLGLLHVKHFSLCTMKLQKT